MTALIKRGDRNGLLLVRPVGGAPERPPAAAHIETKLEQPEEDRMASLEAALIEARGDLAALRQQHAADLEKARDDAFAKGHAEGARQSQALLGTFAKAVERGEAAIAEGLQGSGILALAIARSALGRLLADKGQWNAMIAEIIAVRRQEIDSHLLLGIRVSAKDFPDDDARADIAGACGRTALVFDPDLASGDLLFDLRLGEMEVGPATQGRNLLAFLDRQLAGDERS